MTLALIPIVRNLSVSLNLTLARKEKVEHYIRIKTHKPIVLRFWVESDVNVLCGLAPVSLVLCLPSETAFVRPKTSASPCMESLPDKQWRNLDKKCRGAK